MFDVGAVLRRIFLSEEGRGNDNVNARQPRANIYACVCALFTHVQFC